ncbi:MAG: rhodanese-like domain-containing protein [Succinivibrio sp.]|nr:rhodanese-like domain-containing protein [Succinivibrio sp.]
MADITINPGINSIDYANGYALINTNQCYFIDVREIDEYQSGFIPPAINFPLSTFSKEEALKVLPDIAKPVIIYCRTGRRSLEAAQKLKDYGYYYLIDLGGISKWPYSIEVPADRK